MRAVVVKEQQLEEAVLEGLFNVECPYCGCDTQAEPDAQRVCCQECDELIQINNPYF